MRVWVVYARADRQAVRELELPESATVAVAFDLKVMKHLNLLDGGDARPIAWRR